MQNAFNLGECLFTFCAFWFMVYGLWRAWHKESAEKARQLITRGALVARSHMSSTVAEPDNQTVPVPSTGTGTGTDEAVPEVSDEETPVPAVPLTRHLSDVDIIVLLASQKKGDKYRFSATKIYTLTGGNHSDVLELIRQVQGREKRSNGT